MSPRGSGCRRLSVRIAAGVLIGGGALVLAIAPVAGRIGADIAVIDSNAAAASIGVITRVPAESPGGVVFTATAITLDKAVARAAGFTSGKLVETFFTSSSDQYRNPTLVTAQYPPTATAPADAKAGTAGASGVGTIQARATEQPAADAEAAGGRAGDGTTLAIGHGTSSSHSELRGDGTVVTRAVAVASGISIAGAVTFETATTEAVTTVPPRGEPTADLKVTVTGLLVGGVPAQLTDQGLRVADRVPAGPGELAAFNAALAQLAARGVTVAAAPAVREAGGDRARAEGGAFVVRYSVADQTGGDEEFVVAQARSRSTLTVAGAVPSRPPPLPALPPSGTPGPLGPPAPSPTAGSGPTSPETGDAFAVAPPAATVLPASPAPEPAAAAPHPAPALRLVGEGEDPAAARLRLAYRIFILLAFAGAAIHFARQRTGLA